ncbi:hypothetical protein PENTCL1PPCAC_17455 [Pristionchus entomophagus]|uniref:Chromo domain-containing protein n=1 Tax=Pristionchus entomophagus TaxID=358040 RepID=A0AAV5TLX6_9BILA|nr:hypothetical protein PENTCL1PPCAC_17455 [Pristionchus entomophagus]
MSSPSNENSSGDENTEYEVQAILDDKWKDGRQEFYVKWKDHLDKDDNIKDQWSLDEHDQWLPELHMNCPEILRDYKERKAKKESDRKKEKEERRAKQEEEKRKAKEERKAKEREELANNKHRSTPSDKTNKRERTSRGSSRKTKQKKIAVSDEDEDEDGSSQDGRKEKKMVDGRNGSLDDQPFSSSSLHSRNPPISSSSTAPQIHSMSNLTIKSEVGDQFEFEEEAPVPRSHMDSLTQLQKLRKENKEKGVKKVPAKSVKRKEKPRVCTPIVEDEQLKEELKTPLFQSRQVKRELLDEMYMSSSEEPSDQFDISQQAEQNDKKELVERRSEDGVVEEERENAMNGNEMKEEEEMKETREIREENDQNGDVEIGEVIYEKIEQETEERVTVEGEEGEGERFLVDPDIDENHGYLQGLRGNIVSHDLLLFENNEKATYFKVIFLTLNKSFWIRYDIVRQYDLAGYRMYLKECIQRDEAAKKAEDARRYRELHGI